MKNMRWLRLTGWILTLIMILTVFPMATFAESSGTGTAESDKLGSPALLKRPEEVDVSSNAVFTYTNAGGKATDPDIMDPNEGNQMKLKVSGLNDHIEIIKDTVMAVTLPEKIMVTTDLQGFSSDAVSATLEGNKLLLSWKDEKQDSFEATVAVLPHLAAENDLSGNYVLGTGGNQNYKVMLGSTSFSEGSRGRLKGFAFYDVDGKVCFLSEDTTPSVWNLKHISENYYTVRSNENGKYLKIVTNTNGIILEEATEITAQKLQLEKVKDGYYAFKYKDKSINNSSFSDTKGFASWNASDRGDNAILKLYRPSDVITGAIILTYDINGGTGDVVPERYAGASGEKIELPSLNATKNGQNFLGWAEVSNILSTVPGTNHTYHEVYLPGASYTMKAGITKLYAVYNSTNRNVQFGIRRDGRIVDEPNDNNVSDYIGHFTVNNILKEGHWVIDINPTKPVNEYYIENNVTAALNWVPSAEEIAAALKKEGKVDFDPETQYIHYYVLKYAGKWKIDGVIRKKDDVEITYEVNVPTGVDKTKVSDLPGGYQVVPGTDVLIGADQGSNEIKRPVLNGYYFMGWNTEKDGSGKYYNESSTVHLTNNLHLYAQWISEADEVLEVRITSDWPSGKIGYVGAKIKLTATLTGFEGKIYTLQWQYSTEDDPDNWIDVPDAHEITYTYTLDETTTHYTWRVVAQDIH